MTIQDLSENAYDIGTISGVLQGIELTPSLLPNQKEAIASARQAIQRIEDRNKKAIEEMEWPIVVKHLNPETEKGKSELAKKLTKAFILVNFNEKI